MQLSVMERSTASCCGKIKLDDRITEERKQVK